MQRRRRSTLSGQTGAARSPNRRARGVPCSTFGRPCYCQSCKTCELSHIRMSDRSFELPSESHRTAWIGDKSSRTRHSCVKLSSKLGLWAILRQDVFRSRFWKPWPCRSRPGFSSRAASVFRSRFAPLNWNRLLVLERGCVLQLPARRSSIAFDVGVTDRPPFAVQRSSCGIAFPTSYIAWITSSNGIRC